MSSSTFQALPFHLVNAFTLPTTSHSGNQAAVVLFPAGGHPKADDDDYQRLVARDFNFAETAFVTEREDGKYGLRWWTPQVVSQPNQASDRSGRSTPRAKSPVERLVPGHKSPLRVG
jgi:hypothetical protein